MKITSAILLFFATTILFGQEQMPGIDFYSGLAKFQELKIADSMQPDSPAISQDTFSPKNKVKAFLLSLILPGLGERYVGARKKSEMFMGAEVVFWLTYAGFLKYHDWREQDYETFAAAHARVDTDDKSETFFINVGNYDNVFEYNEAKLRQRNLPDYYQDTEKYFWQWDSEEYRLQYEEIRLSAKRASNYATFALGAILANHLVSAIDAVWSAHKVNKAAEQSSLDWNVEFGDGYIQPAVKFSLVAFF